MPEVQDAEQNRVVSIVVGALYITVIGANLWLAWEWWRDTPEGGATLERWKARAQAVKSKAQECEGCAQRKAVLKRAINRMHWDAERIVEGADVETIPEP
jgi:hypothetical protein